MRSARFALFFSFLLALSSACAQGDPWHASDRKAGKVSVISEKDNEEAWLVPGGKGDDGNPVLLKARLFKPAGDGPFKVAIVSHGSPPSAAARPTQPVPRYFSPSTWLLQRGYLVVIPQRQGYGGNGSWKEDYGNCRGADYVSGGNGTADDIEPVARYVSTLPMVRPDRILLVGVSAGGFGSVAALHRNLPGVFAAINFSGGRGGKQGRYGDENCAPENLVKAMSIFGTGTRVPSLWVYSDNDSFFEPQLVRRMFDAYKATGATAELVVLPPFKKDGHNIFNDPDGRPLWAEKAGAFLRALE